MFFSSLLYFFFKLLNNLPFLLHFLLVFFPFSLFFNTCFLFVAYSHHLFLQCLFFVCCILPSPFFFNVCFLFFAYSHHLFPQRLLVHCLPIHCLPMSFACWAYLCCLFIIHYFKFFCITCLLFVAYLCHMSFWIFHFPLIFA